MNENETPKSHNRYLTAGEFARLASTTKHTLFHYDEIGLFPPAFRAANGYRYYKFEQLETFHVIETLRELDMSLSEIRTYLEQKSPEAFLELIRREEAVVSKKINHLKQIKKWLREKSDQIEYFGEKIPGAIEILPIREQYYVSAFSADSGETAFVLKMEELYKLCDQYGYKSSYNVGYIQYDSRLFQKIYCDYHRCYLLFDAPPKKLNYETKPADTYLCSYHKGHWKSIGETYEKMFSYAQIHGLTMDHIFYEDYLLDELTVTGEENYMTMISVRLLNSPVSFSEKKPSIR